MNVLDIRITKEVVPSDPTDTGMLEELIKAAFNDAVKRMKEKINEEISSMTGGLNIPGLTGGGMMPFGS
jgi:DNA-binding protein YbaB